MLSLGLSYLQSELERLIPEHVSLEPLKAYADQPFVFVVNDVITVTMVVTGDKIKLQPQPSLEPSLVVIEARWPVWLNLLQNLDGHIPRDMRVTGQAEALEALKRWLLDYIDVPDILAHYIGDTPSKLLTQAARGGRAWLHGRHRSLQNNWYGYMADNLQALPYGHEARDLYQQIHQVRLDADRVCARLAQLEKSHG